MYFQYRILLWASLVAFLRSTYLKAAEIIVFGVFCIQMHTDNLHTKRSMMDGTPDLTMCNEILAH